MTIHYCDLCGEEIMMRERYEITWNKEQGKNVKAEICDRCYEDFENFLKSRSRRT